MNPQVDPKHIMAYGNPMFEGGESEPFGAYHLQYGVSPGLGWPAIPGFSGDWYDYFGAIGAVWQGLPEGVERINPYSQTLYPNPNRGELNWNQSETNIQTVRIFDLHGKELFSGEISQNQYKIHHPLPNGIYVVHLIGEGVKFSSKMVVVR